jgi:glycosyltransferase involved in cell wall biosynthesis
VHLYYYLWQMSLFFAVRRLARLVAFDAVHHITFGRYWVPTPLCLFGKPFVWGPVGGADAIPAAFRRALSLNGRIRNAVRDLVRRLAEADPLLRYCARRSTLALATTPETLIRLERLGAVRVQLMAAVGLPEEDVCRLSRYPGAGDDEPTFVSIGNLLHWKGFEFGVRAFARAGLENSRYVVIGDGPERHRLERVAHELGVERQVRFLGRLPRDRVLSELRRCHALVHPSMHDSGGWVCLEAMAAGCPVLCLDLAGPAVLVGDGAGIRVPARTPAETERLLAEAMCRLAGDALLRERMGERGREIVSERFSWDKRGLLMARAYRDCPELTDRE